MMADESAEEKKKKSIHDTSGGITTQYTMAEIEKALHPRSKETVQKELEELVIQFSEGNSQEGIDGHRDKATGSIKDAEKAADSFLELLAKYHFGSAYDAVKYDKKQIAKILQDSYGIQRKDLVKAFKRKGAYESHRSIFEQHVDPIVSHVDEQKKRTAQESLNQYLEDSETRPQVQEHIETRTGRKLKQGYLTLEEAFKVISAYMQMPGAEEAIGDQKAKVSFPDEVAGRPELHHIFEKGDEFHKKYRAVAENVDKTHRFKAKEEREKTQYSKAA